LSIVNRDQEWSLSSPEQTLALGKRLGASLIGGSVLGLVGRLGAGKTLLIRGIAAGNATVSEPNVTSPTFTLIHEYPGRHTLYHIDAYRLNGIEELRSLGFDELLGSDSVVAVEWADRVAGMMPEDTLWLTMESNGETSRVIRARAGGAVAMELLGRLASIDS
jgi:tRNA threonylcarbamoyladenosine biosynthesis protein TsaE